MSTTLATLPEIEIKESLRASDLFFDIERVLDESSIEQLDETLVPISALSIGERLYLISLFEKKIEALNVDATDIMQKIRHVIQVVLAAMDNNPSSF